MVLREGTEVSRFEALPAETAPLVGRDEEIEVLLRRWENAKRREGRVVLISGEPGIGKSRLTAALSERIEAEPHARWRFFCSPYHQDSALYPFITHLERAAGFVRDDGIEDKLKKLRAHAAPTQPATSNMALRRWRSWPKARPAMAGKSNCNWRLAPPCSAPRGLPRPAPLPPMHAHATWPSSRETPVSSS